MKSKLPVLGVAAADLLLISLSVLALLMQTDSYVRTILFICILVEVILTAFFIMDYQAVCSDIHRMLSGKWKGVQSVLLHEELQKLYHLQYEEKRDADTDSQYRTIQLNTLMNQINPHFLYNTLESIRGQAVISDDLVVADMTETLSKFFRYCISQKGPIVELEDEISNLNLYLKIIHFRMPDKFEFELKLSNESLLEYQIPKLTLQPLVENAINHGIYNYVSGGKIIMRIDDFNDTIRIFVQDNGVGMPQETLETFNDNFAKGYTGNRLIQNHGIALYNINNRFRLIFGKDYGIHLFSTENIGTTAEITFPKKHLEEL